MFSFVYNINNTMKKLFFSIITTIVILSCSTTKIIHKTNQLNEPTEQVQSDDLYKGNYHVEGRLPISRSTPRYPCNKQGRVIVAIKVNRKGTVIEAVAGVKGSTTKANCLLEESKKAALKTKWQPNSDAPEIQEGRIIYNFLLY